MKESETFILNIRAVTDEGNFYININISNLSKFKYCKVLVKDFIVLETDDDTLKLNPDIYSLNSSTLTLNKNFDNFRSSSLQSGSTVLAVVAKKSPYYANYNSESYFDSLSINGNHKFWIENFDDSEIIIGRNFYFSLVVVGYN